ncbi:MAG: ADP-ribosylglycohydrolase family protein [Candidatus Sumerlaeia bacterium]|nr:ADP-ribosylglycohydrolase family protein [Candidatus Sumerlaeia bacterium]
MPDPHLVGCILGTAVGDALGLPYEGLSRRRARQMLGAPERHRFLLGRGMVSDDTEHTCFVAQALIASAGEVVAFRRSLAWSLRIWLLGQPAGIGFATLRAILKLWLGFPPDRSGVHSAGNGPAMRAAILGAAIDDTEHLRRLVHTSTRLTHTDPKAEHGALAVAFAALFGRQRESVDGEEYLRELGPLIGDEGSELLGLLRRSVDSANQGQSTLDFADSLGLGRGVSGYALHTVPVAIHAWLSHPRDYRRAVTTIIECGGDADSTAAIVGGIVGTAVGEEGIPADWLDRLVEWPRSVGWMRHLAARLHESLVRGTPARPPRLPIWGVIPRNLVFLVVVLTHGFRRLLPPY